MDQLPPDFSAILKDVVANYAGLSRMTTTTYTHLWMDFTDEERQVLRDCAKELWLDAMTTQMI